MMKRNDYLSGILLLALAAATGSGCNNHDEPTRTDGQRRMVTLSAKAEIGTKADSRVAATDNAPTGGISLAWEATDAITIVSHASDGLYLREDVSETPNVKDFSLTVSSSDNGAATFTGDIAEATDNDKTYYAFYPVNWSITTIDNNTTPYASFDLWVQTGDLDASKTYMATRAVNPNLDNVSFTFNHLTALLKITPVISDVDAGTALTDITISGNYGDDNGLPILGNYTTNGSTAIIGDSPTLSDISIMGGEYKTGTPIYCYLIGGNSGYTNVTITATTADGKFYTGEIIGTTGKVLTAGKAYAKEVAMQLAYAYDESSKTYTVHTARGLQEVSRLVDALMYENTSANITLAADINLSDAPKPFGGSNWQVIGTNVPYTGTFDGNGKSITGLFINGGSDDYQGLIGTLGAGGTVKDLTLSGSSVTGGMNIGSIVGQNSSGTISGCKVIGTSSVSGSKGYVGGIVGGNDGTLIACYASGVTVHGTTATGGITGANSDYGKCIGSFAHQCQKGDASFETDTNISGNNIGTVTHCYYTTDGSSFGHVDGDAAHTTWEIIMQAMNAAITSSDASVKFQWGGTAASSPTLTEVSSTPTEGTGTE